MNGTKIIQMNVRFKIQLDVLSKQQYLFDLWPPVLWHTGQGAGGSARHVNKTQHALPSELRRTNESHGEQV